MAYVKRRKYKSKVGYQAIIRRKGFKTSVKSFSTRTDAKKWARAIERKLDTGNYTDYSEASKFLLGDLFKRYVNENKHKKLRSWKMYEFRINILLKDTIADINLLRLSSKHLAEFRDRKLQEVGNTTFNKYLSLISVVIDTAMQDWGIYLPLNPCRLIKREKEPNPRDRVLVKDEYSRLIEACSKSNNKYLKKMVLFSIETAIRKGELLQMRHDHINFDKRTLLIPFTKIGRPRTIPLSSKAIEILQSMPRRLDGKVFPLTIDSLRSCFKIAKRKAKIDGFRWHDLRRHACSLLFEKGFNVPEVQVFSGHRTSTILLSTYTKLDAEKIATKLRESGQ
ncbi:MAG TPA: site-specific integrase [Alphaproteobacteria bacterium]|nr:site-specific integrase [Alphaproteobacteria bacterium]